MTSKVAFTKADQKWMKLALEIAERGAGYVSPNPMVGCVIVDKEGKKIGQGFHERYGQAHAEVNAIRSVKHKSSLEGATLYVTLEPCSHHGKTEPCCELLTDYDLERVVIAMEDLTEKVSGKGIAFLREQGIQVETGLMKEEAEKLNEFFIHYHRYGRPFVTLKIAQTLDGYIAAPDGDSQWISSYESREKVHEWRSRYDAVMVGRQTALHDNPRLTVRHIEGRQPYRVVLDGPFELPQTLNLFTDQYEEKTILFTHNKEKMEAEGDPMLKILESNYFRGGTFLVNEKEGHVDLDEVFKKLAQEKITSVLVEAGQSLATALLREKLVDKIECFIAPKLLGAGTKTIAGLNILRMNEVLELKQTNWEKVGKDILLTGYI